MIFNLVKFGFYVVLVMENSNMIIWDLFWYFFEVLKSILLVFIWCRMFKKCEIKVKIFIGIVG